MRNIFDQYSQHENRLTHALVTALAEDRKLMCDFVCWATGQNIKKNKACEICEQRLPGEIIEESEDENSDGLPDGWIYDDNGWALLIESKVALDLSRKQLERHLKTAACRGFDDVLLLAISVKRPTWELPDRVRHKEWREVYAWLNARSPLHEWARRTAEYMEVAESKWAGDQYLKEGTLTMFNGIPFSDGSYNYLEAKRILNLAMDELQGRKELERRLGINPKGERRGAIKGTRGSSVWDFLPLREHKKGEEFTRHPHFDMSISREELCAFMTLPNAAKGHYWKNISNLEEAAFRDLVVDFGDDLARKVKTAGAVPFLILRQRHFLSQRGPGILDAYIDFNPATAVEKSARFARVHTKYHPEWCDALFHAISYKKNANLELSIGARFRYDHCKGLDKPEVLDYIAETWLACEPFLKQMLVVRPLN